MQDYQKLEVEPPEQPGDVRKSTQFVVKMTFLEDATLDLLFSKNKETKRIYMSVQRGSSLDINYPWVVGENRYQVLCITS